MDRTVWAGLGWLGLYGATALVGGVYDAIVFDGFIGGFQARVRENYSKYAANRIVDKIVALVPSRQRSTGSCFAVDRNGTLPTAHHVVADAKAIRVLLPSGKWARAELSAALEPEDLAVLRLTQATRGFVLVASSNAARTTRSVLTLASRPGRRGCRVPADRRRDPHRVGPAVRADARAQCRTGSRLRGQPAAQRGGSGGRHRGVARAGAPARPRHRHRRGARARPVPHREPGDLSVRRARSALCYVEATR
jgi:hypothetical protein